jgi:hypothetical protein
MDDKGSSSGSKRGLVATAAIIALLVAVIGVGLADYYLASSRSVTETSVSTTTASISSVVTRTATKITTQVQDETTTQFSVSTITSVSVSDQVITPTTTITIAQTSGNISQITTSEAVLYGGATATSISNASASLLIGFYNPNSTTYITSIVLESSTFSPIINWDNNSAVSTSGNLVSFGSMNLGNTISRGLTSVFTLYPASSSATAIQAGKTYQYVVFFASGAYLEGSLVAQ